MSIEIKKEFDEIFGNITVISNPFVELKVSTDFGPRVLHFSVKGMENMFYQDKNKQPLGEMQPCYNGDILKLYGGHRIWISPEIMPRCYYPDNSSVEAEYLQDGVIFKAPVEKHNNIQKTLSIRLLETSAAVIVDNYIKNCGNWSIEFAPWSITMLDKGGTEVFKQPSRNTNYLSNRHISLWPYSDMSDERVYWGKNFITLSQNENIKNPFKLGINNDDGWAAYFNKNQIFLKLFHSIPNGNYPDNGCSYETYTNADFCEFECLGEVVTLMPNEEVCLSEQWEIYKEDFVPANDENKINEIIFQYLDTELGD